MDELLAEVLAAAAPHRAAGKVADYIPALAKVDPAKLGIAFADKDGRVWGAGDCDEPFSIQSISKVFMLALALERVGAGLVGQGRARAFGHRAFNSIVQLESERGKPRNPLINPGAMVVTDRLIGDRTADAAIADLLALLRGQARDESDQRRRGGGGFRGRDRRAQPRAGLVHEELRHALERGRHRRRRLFPAMRGGDVVPPARARRPVPRLRRQDPETGAQVDHLGALAADQQRDDAAAAITTIAASSPSASACRARAASAAASSPSRPAMPASRSGRRRSTPPAPAPPARRRSEALVGRTGWSVFF